MAEWGFDFARLPLNYWSWGSRDDWSLVREEPLKQIDRAVELGRQHGIHVNINFHRIPGYCINGREMEPMDLFSGRKAERDKALAAAVFHWKTFATRYKGIPSRQLSFDLINEPPWVKPYEGYLVERYDEIVRALVAGIREVDPGRLIVADGLDLGQTPVMEIADLGVAQSTRGYLPKAVSHHTATWVPKDEFESFEVPTWPLKDKKGETWDRDRLKTGADRALAAPRGEGRRGPRRGVGLLQQDAPRRGPRVDGGLPVAVEGSRLGLGAVEPAGQLRRPRHRARGRGLRGLQGPQARPQDARAAAQQLTVDPLIRGEGERMRDAGTRKLD